MKSSLILFIPFLFSFINFSAGDKYLFKDVTNTNLPISTVSGPGMDVESADIDNDGDKDIIIAREFAANKILINSGNGVFTDGSNRIPVFSYDSEDIGIADFDRDNDLDIVFASEDNAIHEFYLNRGDGFFDNANNRLPNFTSNALLVIDLNNDQYMDLIFGSNGASNPAPPGYAKVFMNNGSAFFNEDTTRVPRVLMVPQDIKAADIDGDTDKDLIIGSEIGNKIFINNGSGFFVDETDARLPVPGNEETRKVTLGDVDGDNDIDIFFANVNFRGGQILQDRLLLNNGSGVFTDVTISNLPPDAEQTLDGVFMDLNFDNRPELITSNAFTNRPVKAFLNDGHGMFTEFTNEVFPPTVVAEGLGMKIDDFNNDNLPDLYVVHRRTTASGGNDKLLLRNDTATVGVQLINSNVPEDFKLLQNYPNPFNPETKINFNISKPGFIQLDVFDLSGKVISSLVNEDLKAGSYSVKWAPQNLSSGIYFYKLKANGFESVRKMIYSK